MQPYHCFIYSLHLHRGEQTSWAFAHLQYLQLPLQEHLTSPLQACDSSGFVIQSGFLPEHYVYIVCDCVHGYTEVMTIEDLVVNV